MILGLVVFDEILVAAFNIRFYMSEQIADGITVEAFVIIPMAVVCGFGIHLNYFGAHGDFDFFNGVENQGAKSAVEAVQVDEIFEKQIVSQEAMV